MDRDATERKTEFSVSKYLSKYFIQPSFKGRLWVFKFILSVLYWNLPPSLIHLLKKLIFWLNKG